LRNREPNENDLRTARRTLGLLFREKLVVRLPYFDLASEGTSYVYGLSDKAVKEYGGKTFDEHSARTLDHELEITLFHIRLKRFAEKTGLKLYWQQADLKRKSVRPDAFFALTDPSKPEGRNTHYFFLEIERSKIGNYRDGKPSILRKLAKYYDVFGTLACEKDWGLRQFRVIVVQPTEERRRNLCNALRENYGHRMFWLTVESLYKSDIGGQIFLTPKDHQSAFYGFSTIG
jgi:Replication-relaxation